MELAQYIALKLKKKVHLSGSLWRGYRYGLPFTNQVCLWIASLLIPAQAFTKSAACVGHSHSLARYACTHTRTHTYTHAATEAPLHSNSPAHVVSCTRLVAQSIRFFQKLCQISKQVWSLFDILEKELFY